MEGHLGITSATVDALLSFCRDIRKIDVSYTSVTGRYIVEKRKELVEEAASSGSGRVCRLCRKFNWRCNSYEEDSEDGGSDGDDEEDGNTFGLDGNYHSNFLFDCPHQGP